MNIWRFTSHYSQYAVRTSSCVAKHTVKSSHFLFAVSISAQVTYASWPSVHLPWEILTGVIRSNAEAVCVQACQQGDGQLQQVGRI